MESAKIYNERHITCDTQMYYKFRVCNICQDSEISEENEWGVCNMCVDNRIADGLWVLDGWNSESELPYIRTNENGERIDEQDFTINGEINKYEI
mgnify:FL=1